MSTTPKRTLVGRPSVWLMAGGAIIAAVVVLLQARGPVVPMATAVRTDIARHIVVSGRVRVTTKVQLATQVGGRVVAVTAREGQLVEPGDVVVQLDDREAKASVAEARASVAQARGRLDQLRGVNAVVAGETSRQADVALEQAEADLARAESLAAGGALARADLEQAARALDVARARQQAARTEAAAAATGGAAVHVAEASLAEAEARLIAAQVRLDRTRLTTPDAGVILTRAVEPGDTVQPGTTLLELAAAGMTELVIEPDERNLAWIAEGQIARASADAYPDRVFDARVHFIAPAVDARRGSVEVRLLVPQPPDVLRPDMTVSVDLVVAEKSGVVVVPSEAIHGATTGAPFVWVVERGRVARRAVTVGLAGDGHSEIVGGLDEGASVVLTTARRLDDGQRVRGRIEAP